jgi:hypothetical protein
MVERMKTAKDFVKYDRWHSFAYVCSCAQIHTSMSLCPSFCGWLSLTSVWDRSLLSAASLLL